MAKIITATHTIAMDMFEMNLVRFCSENSIKNNAINAKKTTIFA
jgi:hypothetical protein